MMKMRYLNEDVRLEKLPIIYSDELKTKIEEVIFYNKFEKEILDHWLNELEGMTNWVANRIIAWDNHNEYIHYNNGDTYIPRYGILFEILNYIDEQGIEHNFAYVLDVDITPQNYNLKVPSYLNENKRIIPLTESHIRQIVREILRRYLQL